MFHYRLHVCEYRKFEQLYNYHNLGKSLLKLITQIVLPLNKQSRWIICRLHKKPCHSKQVYFKPLCFYTVIWTIANTSGQNILNADRLIFNLYSIDTVIFITIYCYYTLNTPIHALISCQQREVYKQRGGRMCLHQPYFDFHTFPYVC